jgi:hypothetical protein
VLPQHITYGKGGVIYIERQTRADNAQVSIVDAKGSELLGAQTATVSTVDTTLANDGSKGDTAINVALNTGLAVGVKFWAQDDPEELRVRKVVGNTVHLRGKLLHDHVSGAAVEGTRISYTLTQATAGVNTLAWDGHAIWNIDGGASLEHVAVEITRYPLGDMTGEQDLLVEDDEVFEKLGEHHDLVATRAQAAQDLIARVGLKDRARVFLDSGQSFKRAVAMQWFHNFWRSKVGPEARSMQENYATAVDQELAKLGVLPRDLDQDTVVEPGERYQVRTRRAVR